MEFVLRAYEHEQQAGLYVDSATEPGGNFKACNAELNGALTTDNLEVVRALSSH